MKKNLVGLILMVAFSAQASQASQVCLKQRTSQGDGQTYKVDATLIDGGELNSKVGGFRFSSLDKYVVVFWKQDQASIIDIGGFPLSAFEVDGVDQEGRAWRVAKSSGVCY